MPDESAFSVVVPDEFDSPVRATAPAILSLYMVTWERYGCREALEGVALVRTTDFAAARDLVQVAEEDSLADDVATDDEHVGAGIRVLEVTAVEAPERVGYLAGMQW